jgi:hypothetical protein
MFLNLSGRMRWMGWDVARHRLHWAMVADATPEGDGFSFGTEREKLTCLVVL